MGGLAVYPQDLLHVERTTRDVMLPGHFLCVLISAKNVWGKIHKICFVLMRLNAKVQQQISLSDNQLQKIGALEAQIESGGHENVINSVFFS